MKWMPRNTIKSCIDKVNYGEKAARRAARKLVEKEAEDPEHLRPYPCRDHWHVGRLPVRMAMEQDRERLSLIEEPENVIKIPSFANMVDLVIERRSRD